MGFGESTKAYKDFLHSFHPFLMQSDGFYPPGSLSPPPPISEALGPLGEGGRVV